MAQRMAVFFDIDGTILPHGMNAIPPETIAAIRAAQANGHLCFINTGREEATIERFLREAGFDGIIAGLGLSARMGDKVLWRHPPNEAMTRRVLEASRACGVRVLFEGNEATGYDGWRFPPNEEEQAIIAANRAQGRKIVIFGEHDPLIVTKFTVTPRWGGDEARFLSMLGDSVQVLSYGTGWHEIVPPGFDKGTAMQRMLDYLGLPLAQSIAVGDSLNDLSMLTLCPNGVAMGNGIAKEYPVSFVTLPCTEGGIPHLLRHFGLID